MVPALSGVDSFLEAQPPPHMDFYREINFLPVQVTQNIFLEEGCIHSHFEIGRASCRGRGENSGGAASLKTKRRHGRWSCDWSSDVCSSDLFYREINFLPVQVTQNIFLEEGCIHSHF